MQRPGGRGAPHIRVVQLGAAQAHFVLPQQAAPAAQMGLGAPDRIMRGLRCTAEQAGTEQGAEQHQKPGGAGRQPARRPCRQAAQVGEGVGLGIWRVGLALPDGQCQHGKAVGTQHGEHQLFAAPGPVHHRLLHR